MTIDSLLSVRRAVLTDAGSIAGLCGQLGYPTTVEETAARLARIDGQEDHVLLVAVLPEGQVVGWIHAYACWLLIAEPHARIGGLVVDESCRSQGVGRRLVAAVEQWAAERGFETVRVGSNVVRERTHGFYEQIGYATIKSQRIFRKAL